MTIQEGAGVRIAYKGYASGSMTSNTEATSSSDPGAGSAQILRRVSSSLALVKNTYESNEILTSKQIADFRHGARSVTGSITGEYSPATYFDFIEAGFRGTKASAIALTEADLTSVVLDSSGTIVFGGGNPVSLGLQVGDILNFTNLATSANNSTNFIILSFSSGNNRTLTVTPAPTTETIDSAFNVTTVGKSVMIPSTGHVSRKFGFEHYFTELDDHHFFTECRVGMLKWGLPATGMTTFEVGVMGRDMETASGGSSPFFTSPTAANTNGIFAAVNGLLRVGGSTVGVVTGLNIDLNLNPSVDAVVGQNFTPDVHLGKAKVTGQMTALLDGLTLIDDFKNETEVDILAYLTTTSAVNSPANTIYIPRVKFGAAPVGVTGEGGQVITLPFTALLYNGSTAGVPATTIRVCDTAAS